MRHGAQAEAWKAPELGVLQGTPVWEIGDRPADVSNKGEELGLPCQICRLAKSCSGPP